MSVVKYRSICLLLIACAAATFSCGKSKDAKKAGSKAAQQADSALAAAIAQAPFKDVLEKAGFTIIEIKKFPSMDVKASGQTVVYKSTAQNPSGGVLYFRNERNRSFPTWHWYFDDGVPDSARAVDINEDGLWDVRIWMNDGSEREFLQDEEFTLFAEPRSDWIALNGTSSSPTDPDHAMWKCLDGLQNTIWSSAMPASGQVFLEVLSPFGIHRGIVTVQTVDEGRPRDCELIADGKSIKRFTLENRAGEQKVQFGSDPHLTGRMRFVVHSSYGEGGDVSIAEFKLE
jgi:hypothetical protein